MMIQYIFIITLILVWFSIQKLTPHLYQILRLQFYSIIFTFDFIFISSINKYKFIKKEIRVFWSSSKNVNSRKNNRPSNGKWDPIHFIFVKLLKSLLDFILSLFANFNSFMPNFLHIFLQTLNRMYLLLFPPHSLLVLWDILPWPDPGLLFVD